MDYKKYHNCLRIQITPDEYQDERIDNIAKHCAEYGFDNVMLMLNLEEFNIGHIPLDKAKEWVKVLKKAKDKLIENGISVSVNHWMEMGHVDRGRHLRPDQNFGLFTDWNGTEATMIACANSKSWREYYCELVRLLVKELDADTFWIEDDFRLQGHPPLVGVGCFCDEHMKLYNAKVGKEYTREEFVKKIFTKGGLTPERKAWLDVNREVMLETADLIVDAAKSVKPDCDVAIMTSWPGGHCVEGRDWHKLFDILGKNGGNKINRLHLTYGEVSGKDFLYDLNTVAMPIRAMCPDDVKIMPEVEQGSASLYRGGTRYLKYMLMASIPLVLNGMTYSIYDFVANGTRESFGFGKAVKDVQPYMQAIRDLDVKFSQMQGVIIPVDQTACYKKDYNGELGDIYPKEYAVGGYLSGLGVTYKYSTEKSFKDKSVFMSGSSMDYFTDDELKQVFSDNFTVVDGTGVLKLKDRDMLSLIGAKDATLRVAESGFQTYEECADKDLYIDGVRGLRASSRTAAGNFVEIDYCSPVSVKTEARNEKMEVLAPAFTVGDKFAVLPYCITAKQLTLFCDLRRYFLEEAIAENTKDFVIMDNTGINPYMFNNEKGKVLMLVNSNLDDYDEINFTVGNANISKISQINLDGKTKQVKFSLDGNRVSVKVPFEHYSSTVLIIE